MPPTVFDGKGVSAACRAPIEAAVKAAGPRLAPPYKAWIAADPFQGCVRVLITGPQGFERTVAFARDEAAAMIAAMSTARTAPTSFQRRCPKPEVPGGRPGMAFGRLL